jgi:hypothetical protein
MEGVSFGVLFAAYFHCNPNHFLMALPDFSERSPYSDTSRTYAINTRIYGYIKGRFPSSLATAKPRFYVGKFGQRTKVTLVGLIAIRPPTLALEHSSWVV